MTVGFHLTNDVRTAALSGRLTGLSGNAAACLYVMAQLALDKPTKHEQARVYFAGWQTLALCALMRDRYDDAAERAVGRALRELRDAGVIKDVGRRNGVRQGTTLYELLL